MKRQLAGLIFGIFFVMGQGLIQFGTALETLDGPVTAIGKAAKLSARAVKATPKASLKATKAVAKAIK